ncbi:MAG: ABC transporter ATP-binding protein [Phycisphaerae bacterium]
MATAIELREVTKRYGQFTAVSHLDLEIREGELFAFLGPNGAGKTTTIKMITGLLRADSGLVSVCGHRMGMDGRMAKAQLAYVPDQPFLYDKLTGREFLEFVGQMYGLPRDVMQTRTRDLIGRLEMGDFLDQLTESYSHGMKQRTALAAALLHEPRVLITDEPMVGLDPRTVRTVKDLMRDMTRAGRTVFMSTHTLEVAEAVADRIGIIRHGRLVAIGTLEELRTQAAENASLEDIFLKLTADEQDVEAEAIPR